MLHDEGVVCAAGAKVELTKETAELFDSSPWAADRTAAELIRAKGRAKDDEEADVEQPPSIARSLDHVKLLSRILAGIEGVAAARLAADMNSSNRLLFVSAGGPGVGTTWTSLHHHVLDLMPNASAYRRLAIWYDLPVAARRWQAG